MSCSGTEPFISVAVVVHQVSSLLLYHMHLFSYQKVNARLQIRLPYRVIWKSDKKLAKLNVKPNIVAYL